MNYEGIERLGFLIHDAGRLMRRRFETLGAAYGLSSAQWRLMVRLVKEEGVEEGRGVTQARLAELLEIEPITLVRILDKLEARGLIERRQHASDRRVWLLFLTPAAHPILAEMRAVGDRTRAEALASIPDEDRVKLLDTLTQMKANLLEACRQPVDDKEANHG